MGTERSERLREARAKAGFGSAEAAAEAFGWKSAGYRHHENGTRNFGLDGAKKYGRAFKVKPGWLLGMDGVDSSPPNLAHVASAKLLVGAPVAAGVWREEAEDFTPIEIDLPPPVPNSKRFGYRVIGRSMDEFYEEGTVLDCISIFVNGVEPQAGDHVIVRRTKPDGLRELTVKEFAVRGGEFYLVPRSSDSSFQEMHIGRPDGDTIDGIEIEVIAFVVSAISPRSLRVLERLGKVRPA